MDSKTCLAIQKKKGKIPSSPKPKRKTMLSFFSRKPKAAPVATTATQPATISAQPTLAAPIHEPIDTLDSLDDSIMLIDKPPHNAGNTSTQTLLYGPETDPVFYDRPAPWQELAHLAVKLTCPADGTENNYLAGFEGPPESHDDPGIEDGDIMEEIVNLFCHCVFGYDDSLHKEQVVGLRPDQLRGLLAALRYFVEKQGVNAGMFQGRLMWLLDAVRTWLVGICTQGKGFDSPRL
jgi:hypothetical protein